jgi:NDP-sugar pyrophosphorylase family protein
MSHTPSENGKDLIILAGGLGTRIRSVLGDTPKVLAPVAGRPLLWWLIEPLQAAGFTRAILALGWQSPAVERVMEMKPPGAIELVASVETAPLGTGGALRHALAQVRSATVAVINGDTLVRLDWRRFLAFHAERAARISLAIAGVPDRSAYGTVEAAPDGAIHRFEEKDQTARGPAEVSAGCYLLQRDVLDSIPEGRAVSIERDVFPGWIGRGLYACRCVEAFLDVGTPAGLEQAASFVRRSGEAS